jgi:PKD repeat protein
MRLLLLTVALSVLTASSAQAAPSACFTYAPTAPVAGQTVTFNSSCSTGASARGWEFDNSNQFNDGGGVTATRRYTAAGTYTVKLGVVDSQNNYDIETKQVVVGANHLPAASFTVAPAAPQTNENVTFTSTSSDADGPIVSQAWDLDNDGTFDDGTGTSATRQFASSGSYTVRLKAVDNSGAETISSKAVAVSNRAPTSSFTFAPAAPLSGQTVTFTSSASDPDGTVASYAWDLDNDGMFDDGTTATVTRSFPKSQTYSVRLRVTDDKGAQTSSATQSIVVGNRAPTAAFDVAPAAPLTGQSVTFSSTATDADGAVASQSWDLDNDGAFDDGSAATASRSFATAGTYTVKLRAVDDDGVVATATKTVTVTNRPPVASFVYSPTAPLAGSPLQLTSTAVDQDGTVAKQEWDLDGDGAYDDATGAGAAFTPAAAGSYPIALKVTDDRGATGEFAQTIAVAATPAAPALPDQRGDQAQFDSTGPAVVVPIPVPEPVVSPVAPLRWLDPFPVVRIRGLATRKGARLTLLAVTAPDGARAELRCSGRGCPLKRQRQTARTRGGKATAVVRFKRMERYLPAGTKIQVLVTNNGVVGKFTSFTIRRLTLPARTDRCVMPGSTRPVKCPPVAP